MITIGANDNGSFEAPQVWLDVSYSPSMIFFGWDGCGKMDARSDDGHAEPLHDGSVQITFPKTVTRPFSAARDNLQQPVKDGRKLCNEANCSSRSQSRSATIAKPWTHFAVPVRSQCARRNTAYAPALGGLTR